MLLNEYSRYDFKDLLSFFDKIKCPIAVKQMKALEEGEIFEFKNKQLQSIIEESSRNVDVESDVLVLNKEFESKEVQDYTDIPKEIVLKVNNIFYKFHVSKLLQEILNQLNLSKSKTSDSEDYKQNKDPKNKL